MEALEFIQKVPFKQHTRSGCGSHSLANLFNDVKLLEGCGDLKYGERVVDLNKKLERLYPDFYIEVIFASPSEMKNQPNKLIDPLVFQVIWDKMEFNIRENFARPFLITVKGALFHCILVLHNFKNDLYYVVDSLQEDVQIMAIDQLIGSYHITAVELVCSWRITDQEDQSVFFNKLFLEHIIPNGE